MLNGNLRRQVKEEFKNFYDFGESQRFKREAVVEVVTQNLPI